MTQELTTYHQKSLDDWIADWLRSTYTSGSKSEKTLKAYRDTLQSFRRTLQSEELDLNYQEHAAIAEIAEQWAWSRSAKATGKRKSEPVSDTTHNQRLAIVSSFYLYIHDQFKFEGIEFKNPIDRLKRPKVRAYEHAAEPLGSIDVQAVFASIEEQEQTGEGDPRRLARDYALFAVWLHVGRRVNEIISLRAQDVTIKRDGKVQLRFERCKGGKKKNDLLDSETSGILLDYLRMPALYGENLKGFTGDAPIWLSFSNKNKHAAMGYHTARRICEYYLNDSRTHILRHTFAVISEQEGASLSDLKERMGHASLNQLTTYLDAVRPNENPISEKLTKAYGARRRQTGEKQL